MKFKSNQIKTSCLIVLFVSGLIACGDGKVSMKQTSAADSLLKVDKLNDSGHHSGKSVVWSELKKDSIDANNQGVLFHHQSDSTKLLFALFAEDSTMVELFMPEYSDNLILERRKLPKGGYVWNLEDDDTKNLQKVDGLWQISRRGKVEYREKVR